MTDTPKRECLCGINVHDGTKIVGWFSLVCAVLTGNIISLIFIGFLLHGAHTKNPDFYVAYLILEGLGFAFFAIVIVPLLVVYYGNATPQDPKTLIIAAVIIVAILVVSFYLHFLVPYRSYKLLKYEKKHAVQIAILSVQETPLVPYTPSAPELPPKYEI